MIFLNVEFSYFLVSVDCWAALVTIQFRVELGIVLMRLPKSSPHFRLTGSSSWIWRSCQTASLGHPTPAAYFSRAQDPLKTSRNVIEQGLPTSGKIVEHYLR